MKQDADTFKKRWQAVPMAVVRRCPYTYHIIVGRVLRSKEHSSELAIPETSVVGDSPLATCRRRSDIGSISTCTGNEFQ